MVDVEKAVIARMKSQGNTFEVLVDCDKALALKAGSNVPLEEVLAAEHVYSDSKKGLLASETQMAQVFGTSEPRAVALAIIKKGEVQVTAEHKARLVEQKRRQIIQTIHRNGIDPRTKLPHPVSRLELAFEEARVRIDEHKSPEQQVEAILKQLRPILPIRLEKRQLSVRIPAIYAGKAYAPVSAFGKLLKDEWLNDGSWACVIEMPAGLQNDLMDTVNKLTRGEAEIKILKSEEGEL